MAAKSVVVQDLERGEFGNQRATITVDGVQIPGVRSVQLSRVAGGMNVVTLEIIAADAAWLPAATAETEH